MLKRFRSRPLLRAAVLLALAASLSACVGRREAAVGTVSEPLVVLLSPSHAPASAGALAELERLLSSSSGLTVATRVAASPFDAIEQFGRHRADAGILTLDEFFVAREEYEVRPGLQVLRGKGETEFDAVLLVQAESRIRDLADLEGARVAFVDPYSFSGYLLPAQHLRRAGVRIEPVFTESHGMALRSLREGRAAAAATYADAADGKADVRILARTGTAPNEPLVFRRGLRPEKRAAIEAAFRSLASSPEGGRALAAVANITGFGPVPDLSYRAAHNLLLLAGKSVYDMVPEGENIQRLNQPYIDAR